MTQIHAAWRALGITESWGESIAATREAGLSAEGSGISTIPVINSGSVVICE